MLRSVEQMSKQMSLWCPNEKSVKVGQGLNWAPENPEYAVTTCSIHLDKTAYARTISMTGVDY